VFAGDGNIAAPEAHSGELDLPSSSRVNSTCRGSGELDGNAEEHTQPGYTLTQA